jgi:hypothetical protein
MLSQMFYARTVERKIKARCRYDNTRYFNMKD